MLDTNIISDLIRNPRGRAAKRIAKVGEDLLIAAHACTVEATIVTADEFKRIRGLSVENWLA